MVINSTAIDQELPWDRMWEYVLGEGDDQSSAYSLARRTSSRVSTPSPTPPLLPPSRKQRHEVPRYQTSTNVKDSEDTIDVQSDTWGRMSSGGAFTRSSSTKRQSSTGSEMSFPADFGDDYTMRQRRSSSTTGDNFPPPRQRSSASSTTLTESIISPVHTSSSKSRRDYTSASSETSIFQRKSSASSLTRNQHSLQDRYEMDQSVTSSLGREASLVRESSESGRSLSSISKTKRKIGFWRRKSDDIQLDETSTKESFDPAGITQQQQQSQRELEQSPPPKQEEDIASSPTTSEIQAGSGKQPSHRLLPPPKLPERPGSGRNIRKSSGSARVSNKTMGERSSSSSSHKYVTASRDDEATQESAGSEIMEQRDSGSPDTTLETDFSIEGPLSALFMTCNDADNFSIEGSGNKRSFANQNHSSPSAVAASAAAAAAAAVALRRIGDVNTCMIAPKESYKGNRGKNTAGGSKRGKKDSSASPMSAVNGNAVSTTTTTTKSNGAGVLFFDSLAKGIDDFLDPAFSYSLDDGGEQTLCLGEFSDDGSSSDDKRLQAANHPSQSKRTSTTNFNYSRKNRNRKDSKLTFGSYGDSRSRSSLSPITEEVSQSADRDTSFDNETTDGKRDDSFSRARSPSSQRQEKKEIRRETLPGYDAGGDETKRDRNTSSEVLSDRDADFFRFPADFKGKSVNKKSGDNGRRSGFASEQAGDQKDKDGFFSFAGSRSPGSISITGYDSGGITGTTSQVGFSSGHLSPTSASSTNGQIMQMHPVSPTSQSGVAGTTSAIETLSPSSLDGNGSRYTKVSSNMSRSGLTTTGAAYGQLSPSSSATRSGATTVAMGPTSPKTTGNRQALNRHSDYPSSPGLNPPLSFPSDLFLDGVVPSTPTETVVSRSGLVSTNHISLTSTTDLQSIRQEQEHKKKALLLTRQMTSPSDDAEDDEGTFSRSSWDDEGSERSRTGLVLGKHVKRHDSHSRSCIRLPICFSGRKSYEQVYAVSELDAATQRPSRQLSVDDGSDLLRKARCSPFTGTKQVSRSSHDTTTSKTHEETSGDMLNNSWMHNSDIQSLYEYDFDSTAHMSVVFDQFGGDPEEEMRVVLHDSPPEKVKEGLVEYNKVVVKVEVSPTGHVCLRCGVSRVFSIPLSPVSGFNGLADRLCIPKRQTDQRIPLCNSRYTRRRRNRKDLPN